MLNEEREAIEALGWQTVNVYGYSHATGWTIGIYCLNGTWESILWDGKQVHARFTSPLAAAQYHAEFIGNATALD
ncbi:hypothetical protein N0A02_32995 (plasmid) [Paraburkholderia acidicola]|uniref:Uncharacterized protein n=1 Tax=Paraburkholderia acidicola TaxID=1912599 RepID=A0ABV1LZK0_9BURK